MPDFPFNRLGFIEANASLEQSKALVVGLPYDGTASYRAGSRFAPDAIRQASFWNLETYDPLLDADLLDHPVCDLGDLHLESSSGPEDYVRQAEQAIKHLPDNIPVIGLGGEHTVSLPLIEHALKRHPGLNVLVFDAHTDLRDEYDGSRFSHACTVRRIIDRIGPDRVFMVGVRSGTKPEFDFGKEKNLFYSVEDLLSVFDNEQILSSPLYVSIDIDAFDPVEAPGTGTVEPGGVTWREAEHIFYRLAKGNLVGADIVEVAPSLDSSGRTAVLAARIVRFLVLKCCLQNQ